MCLRDRVRSVTLLHRQPRHDSNLPAPSPHSGQGCEQLPSLEVALDNPPTNNAKHLYTPKADYTGNILQLTFNQWESTAFSAIRFTLNDKPTFYVGGDGKVRGSPLCGWLH